MVELIATFAAGLWTGAALYIGIAEHPAALKVGLGFATEYFRHMSKRTAPLMMILAAIGAVAGIVAWISGDGMLWLIGGIILAAMFPFTAILIVPTNLALLRIDADHAPERAAALHARWGLMHHLRTIIGTPAFGLYLWALWAGPN
jgi:hypothetical protein